MGAEGYLGLGEGQDLDCPTVECGGFGCETAVPVRKGLSEGTCNFVVSALQVSR